MANDVLGAQAYLLTIQQLFSGSSDMKKQTCCILKYLYLFWKKYASVGKPQDDS